MSEAEYYRAAYESAEAAIMDAHDILGDMHHGDECKFEGGEGCMACLAQESLMSGVLEEDAKE